MTQRNHTQRLHAYVTNQVKRSTIRSFAATGWTLAFFLLVWGLLQFMIPRWGCWSVFLFQELFNLVIELCSASRHDLNSSSFPTYLMYILTLIFSFIHFSFCGLFWLSIYKAHNKHEEQIQEAWRAKWGREHNPKGCDSHTYWHDDDQPLTITRQWSSRIINDLANITGVISSLLFEC